MVFLLLCILANVGIFVTFRYFGSFKVDTLQAIVVNYACCVLTGALFISMQGTDVSLKIDFSSSWFLLALVLGAVFIVTFYLMALTTQKLGVTVSTVAGKMSLIIPVLFSLFILKLTKGFDPLNVLGIFFALIAILLTSLKKGSGVVSHGSDGLRIWLYLLPLSVFLLSGIIDTSFNFINVHYLSPSEAPVFPIVIFASAATIGVILLVVKRVRLDRRSILGGLWLGLINYFSVYLQLKALNAFDNDGALVYPVLNIGIIVFSAVFSLLLFRERLSRLNYFGLALAVGAILLLTHQQWGLTFR